MKRGKKVVLGLGIGVAAFLAWGFFFPPAEATLCIERTDGKSFIVGTEEYKVYCDRAIVIQMMYDSWSHTGLYNTYPAG